MPKSLKGATSTKSTTASAAVAVATASSSEQLNVESDPASDPNSSTVPEINDSNESRVDEVVPQPRRLPGNSKTEASKAAAAPSRGRKRTSTEAFETPGPSSQPRSVKPSQASAVAKPGAVKKTQNGTDPVAGARGRKKQRHSKRPHAQPVYEDIWKDIYLAGTEWDQLQLVYRVDWDFGHLDEALNEGDLKDKKVFLFGATEPQLLKMSPSDDKGEVVPIPIIIAVVSEATPPNKVGLKSVQKAEEEIVPMSELRMFWQPFRPSNVAHKRMFTPNVLVMQCNERRARLRNMGEVDVHRYDYVLPYFFNPDLENDDFRTEVNVLVPLEGLQAPLMCDFDFEMDDLDDFVEEQLKENSLDMETHSEALKNAIREAVRAAKLKIKKQKEDRKKEIDSIPPEEREAIRNTKLIKFYPVNEWPDLSAAKSKYVNRYYGQAHELRDDYAEE